MPKVNGLTGRELNGLYEKIEVLESILYVRVPQDKDDSDVRIFLKSIDILARFGWNVTGHIKGNNFRDHVNMWNVSCGNLGML